MAGMSEAAMGMSPRRWVVAGGVALVGVAAAATAVAGGFGALVPRNIINRFVCTYNGEEIFSVDLFPAISANPFIAFTTVATESGLIAFRWIDDQGRSQLETVKITVE